jgi:heat shock protein HslJ
VARSLILRGARGGSEQRGGGPAGPGSRRARRWAAIGIALGAGLAGPGCQRPGAPPGPAISAATPTAAFPLDGTTWRAEELGGQRTEGATATVTFEGASRVAGSTGCNRYFAPLSVSGFALRVGEIAMTRMACSAALMDQETRFVAALAAVRGYRQEGEALRLVDESERTLLRLVRN